MKSFVFAALAITAAAQRIWIQAPVLDQQVIPGDDLVIEIQSQDSSTPYTDIAAAIGIQPWSRGSYDGELGEYLVYQGNWSIEGFAYPQGGLYTNVTVTVPSDVPLGPAVLSVAMFQVYSSENSPSLQTASTNISVVSSS
ncbi:hypothetical protein ZTR_07733 [Talaromyces verruculosus]|nr:hypothetical protein ZTR_07733 [Talaromyces verruculosus]